MVRAGFRMFHSAEVSGFGAFLRGWGLTLSCYHFRHWIQGSGLRSLRGFAGGKLDFRVWECIMKGLNSYLYYFGGFLTGIPVQYTPKPHSNY